MIQDTRSEGVTEPPADPQRYYVVLRVMSLDAIEIKAGNAYAEAFLQSVPVTIGRVEGEDQPVGLLPVFGSYEAAESWSDGGRYEIIMVSQK